MTTILEISTETLDQLMHESIGTTDLSNDALIDKGTLLTAHTCYKSCAHTVCFCIKR